MMTSNLLRLGALCAAVTCATAYRYPGNCSRALFCEENCDQFQPEELCKVTKGEDGPDLWDLISTNPDLSIFAELLEASGLDQLLRTGETFIVNTSNILSVWAPSNEAMRQLPSETVKAMEEDSEVRRLILETHISYYDPEAVTESRTLVDGQFLNSGITVGEGAGKATLVSTQRCKGDSPSYLFQLLPPQAINGDLNMIAGVLVPCILRDDPPNLPVTMGGLPITSGNIDVAKYFQRPLMCDAAAAPDASKLAYYTKDFIADEPFELNLGNGQNTVGVNLTELKVEGLITAMSDTKAFGEVTSWVCYTVTKGDNSKETCAKVDGQRGNIGFNTSEGKVTAVRAALGSNCGGRSTYVAVKRRTAKPSTDPVSLYLNWGCNWSNYTERIQNVTLSNVSVDRTAGNMPQVQATVRFDIAPRSGVDPNEYPPAADTLVCLAWQGSDKTTNVDQCTRVPPDARGVFATALAFPEYEETDDVKGRLTADVRELDSCSVFAHSDAEII